MISNRKDTQLSTLSVIVRTSDRPALLGRALRCLAGQTRRPHEVVVVNEGGESDVVRAVAQAHGGGSEIVFLDHARPLGRGGALNAGIERASGGWVAILDDDDTLEPDCYATLLDRALREPRCSLVVCQTLVISEKAGRNGEFCEYRREPMNPGLCAVDLAELAAWNQFTINAAVFTRAAWMEVGRYREDLPVLEDWEFNIRLALRYEPVVVPLPLAHYRKRPAAKAALANSAEHAHRVVYHQLVNQWIRADFEAGRFGLGNLALAGITRREVRLNGRFFRVLERFRERWRRMRGGCG